VSTPQVVGIVGVIPSHLPYEFWFTGICARLWHVMGEGVKRLGWENELGLPMYQSPLSDRWTPTGESRGARSFSPEPTCQARNLIPVAPSAAKTL
jgi:hypothetical protein